MRYFAHLGTTYAAKNKYCTEVQIYLQSLDGLIVDDIDFFKQEVSDDLEKIHANYPRCKKAEIQFFETPDDDDIIMSFSIDIAYLYLYKIKEEV